MRRRSPLSSIQRSSEINLTPLMDMTFLLLVVFVITFPMIEQGIPVKLPKGKARELKNEQSRSVTIDEEGRIYLDKRQLPFDMFEREVKRMAQEGTEQLTIMVRGDEKVNYGNVVKVLRVLHAAGITKMALVTDPGK